MRYIVGFLKRLRDLLFPKICFGCGSEGSFICKKCLLKKGGMTYEYYCPVCGKVTKSGFTHKSCSEETYLDGLRQISSYNEVVKKTITTGKFEYYEEIFIELGNIMGDFLKLYKLKEFNTITFVPMNFFRRNKRGFNQAFILAKVIARKNNLILKNLLGKKISTAQVGKREKDRSLNIINTFYSKKSLKGENIIIIDDVFTTGATLNQCAKILKENGAKKVLAFVFAKARLG